MAQATMTPRESGAKPTIVQSDSEFLAYDTTYDGFGGYVIECIGRFSTRAAAEAAVRGAGR